MRSQRPASKRYLTTAPGNAATEQLVDYHHSARIVDLIQRVKDLDGWMVRWLLPEHFSY